MKNIYAFLFIFSALLYANTLSSQTSTDFWFAPPEVTSGHGAPATQGLRLVMATTGVAATVTIDQPANPAFNGGAPIVILIPVNSGHIEDMTPHRADLETMPQDVVLNTGLHISSTANITCYYEVTTTNNPDIFSLKGQNGIGTEFYTPFQTTWQNGVYTPTAYTSFDIVATQNATTVLIYPRVPLDGGHPALASYSITLNQGQTYSGAVTGGVGVDNPAGTTIVSDKPIAVSIKDDSVWPQPAGCKDLNGDQLVPADIVGNDYIVTQGGLTVPEYAYIVSTKNNNIITVAGLIVANLFVGETYRVPITAASTFIQCSEPAYCYHVSGFGCETGGALLPPLNCAGSSQVNVVRSTTEFFGLNIVVKAGNEGNFLLNGNPALIPAAAFAVVPNTGGVWMSAQISYNTIDVPVGVNNLITNTSDVFSIGLINGGAATGTRFGYFSEFSGRIFVDAGVDQIVCANDTAQLTGSVTGGATTGIWTTNGSGTFLPNATTLNAQYTPSPGDILVGSVILTLSSTSVCFPETDVMTITFTPAPVADAGLDQTVCGNNPIVTLAGTIAIATGGQWSGGAGTYVPSSAALNTVYTPTVGEIASGSLTLYLTTTGNGSCNPEFDSTIITFGPAPTANAGLDQSVCENNPNVTLSGAVTIATGGQWSGGAGTYAPNSTTLNAVYTPTAAEILAGTLNLTLTTTGNGNCTPVNDVMTITFTPAPTANADTDQSVCANNSNVTLNGSVTGATGGSWTGGLGIYTPNNTTLNATYSPTAAEILAGTVTLTLTTTGNGGCLAVIDNMAITITPGPTVNAGLDQSVCANNQNVTLNGSVTVATGGSWTGGGGSYAPDANTLNATYSPTAAEILAGTVTLTLTTTGNGGCLAVTDNMTITITPAPTVNAGVDQALCSNNPNATLAGVIGGATGGQWSGGAGIYIPSSTSLNAIYTPTAGELASGNVILTLTSTGNGNCNAVTDNIQLTFTLPPTANAGIDQTLCANNANINLNGSITVATGGQWTGGLGIFTPNNSTLNAIYTPTVGEIASGTLNLTLITTGNGNCNAVADNMTVTFTTSPTVNAGTDQTVCANNPTVTLNGAITVASGGVWTGGGGVFAPNNTTLNAGYTPSATEITAGAVTLYLTTTGNGNCLPEVDSMIITITPLPIVNAGPDLTSCSNNSTVILAGTVTGATGGIWSGGTGVFTPGNTALGATYTPSAAEITAGTVILTLTSTGNGNCNAVTDNVTITITPPPSANAGLDVPVCSNNPSTTLNGSVNLAAGGVWSGGLGVFNPNNNTLNAVYTPSAGEIAAGSVTLTLTTTGNGTCNPEQDQVIITFTASPTVSAGLDQSVCANNPSTLLNGAIGIATGAQWTGGLGSFAPNNTTLNATYTPTAVEITAGSVTLYLTTTGNGNCLSVTDSMLITITSAPVVNAGADTTICVSNLSVLLSGSVFGPTVTGNWTTSGTGVFVPSSASLNATYQASAADSANGSVTLTLTSTNNGNCNAESDTMTITILPAGGSIAGADQVVCANNANVSLNGVVTGNSAGGVWSSSGTGIFLPNATTLITIYVPGPADIAAGTVTLTLTANSCNLATDNLTVTITPAPFANAGNDTTVCVSNLNIPLNGIVSGASTTGIWTTTGTGIFVPNNTTLNATYQASAADSASQGVSLILTPTGIGSCLPVNDTININLFPTGLATAGPDQTVCANNANILLNGSITGGATSGIWTTTGSGTFTPSDTLMNPTYIPSSGDTGAGTVTLILTATNSCSLAADFLVVTIDPAPVVVAGPDQSICGTIPVVNLTGLIAGSTTTGIWSTSGTGTFSNPTIMTPIYTASAADTASGQVIIYLTSTNNGLCNSVVDSLVVTISTGISVNAGPDQSVCASSTQAQLLGSVFNGSITGQWTTLGSGTFFPSDSILTAVYQISSGDSAAGTVTLILTSTNNGSCAVETDTMVITFGSSAFAFAGIDQSICGDNLLVNLSGLVSGGSSTGIWTSSGNGTFTPTDTSLTTSYIPDANDSLAGTVNLFLTTTNNQGGCLSGIDTVTINIDYVPVADAGPNQTICNTIDSVYLNGNLQNSLSGTWTTSGTGVFVPNATTLNAVYIMSAVDITNGSVTLVLTSDVNGTCLGRTDTMTIIVNNPLTANFGWSGQCVDNLINFYDSTTVTSGSISSWYWDFGDASTSVVQNPTHTFTTVGNFTVMLVVSSPTGCVDTIFQTVTINPLPIADFNFSAPPYLIDEPINMNDASSGATTWTWDFGDAFGTSTIQSPVYTYTSTGSYIVQLIVTNAFGCQDSISKEIIIGEDIIVVYPPELPTGFTPNGDGNNDVLLVRGGPFNWVIFDVYNEWGEKIFHSEDENEGWDGTHKGEKVPVGVYVYKVKGETIDGLDYSKSGKIALIR